MELTDLRYFSNVAQTCSFVRGAELSHVTPPAVSKAVRRLEEELGTQLLVRTTRRVSVTDTGAILLRHCSLLFRQVDTLRRDLDDAGETIRGELRIGASEVFSNYLLPTAISRAVSRHPELIPRCYAMTPEQIQFGLREHTLDIGFTMGTRPLEQVSMHPISDSEGALVCGPNHPLFAAGVVTAEDLQHYPSVVPRFWQREYVQNVDLFPDDRYPRRIGATTELLQMAIQMCLDGVFLGYFPIVAIRCHLNHGELKSLQGLQDLDPFHLHGVTAQGPNDRAGCLLILNEVRRTVEEAKQIECA